MAGQKRGGGGDKRGHSWKNLCLYPSVLTIWLLSFTRGMLPSGGLRESTGGFGLFLEWPWRRARSERAAAGEVWLRPPTLHSGRVFSYQVNAIHFYVLEEDAGHMLCVPLHNWVIWEIPGRKKQNVSIISNQAPTFR